MIVFKKEATVIAVIGIFYLDDRDRSCTDILNQGVFDARVKDRCNKIYRTFINISIILVKLVLDCLRFEGIDNTLIVRIVITFLATNLVE